MYLKNEQKAANELFEVITNQAIVEEKQGYAFYYQQDDTIITKTNGKQGDENNEDISEDISFDTHFRLASVSKQFIAMAILSLVEQKKVPEFYTCVAKKYGYT